MSKVIDLMFLCLWLLFIGYSISLGWPEGFWFGLKATGVYLVYGIGVMTGIASVGNY